MSTQSKAKAFMFVGVMVVALASPIGARTWHVPSEAPTIKAGIDSASAGDIVEVACGTYYECNICVKDDVILRSETESYDCVTIDAEGQEGSAISNGSGEIIGFTIIGGIGTWTFVGGPGWFYAGGGMFCTNGDIVIRYCVFSETGASGSSAVWCSGTAAPAFIECIFSEGVTCRSGSAAFTDCIFSTYGVLCDFGRPEFTGCHFVTNATRTGLSLFGCDSPPVMHCVFRGNNKGIVISGSVQLSNCTFIDNNLAIDMNDGSVNHSIIAFNNETVAGAPFCARLNCCNVYGNDNGDYVGWLEGQENVRGNFSADPCFCDDVNGDYQLCADSWCLPGHHPWGCEELVGAFGQGCDACDCMGPVVGEPATWGSVKALYR